MAPQFKPSKELKDVHVLVVDDDRRITKLLYGVLGGLGFQNIHMEHSAEEALEFLSQKEVDLIICDWIMEGMDGVTMIESLRKDLANPNQLVPVIMLSGNSERPQVEAARDGGVTEYVMKPFTAKSLCSRIISVIDHPRSFVISGGFTGHSRRRKSLPPIEGVERRKPRK